MLTVNVKLDYFVLTWFIWNSLNVPSLEHVLSHD